MLKRVNSPKSNCLLHPPAYPFSGPNIFRRLRAALTEALTFQPSFDRLGRIIGQGTNTTSYWFQVFEHPHVQGFLCLLERLPEAKRFELIKDFCRPLPDLGHPRLAHDPIAVTGLQNLLRKSTGVSLLRGGTEFQRTFLLQSLGHTFQRTAGRYAGVAGLDVHEPVKWVPIETMHYLAEPLAPLRLNDAIHEVWQSIVGAGARLILLNGVWSAAPELQQGILAMSRKSHVVIADGKLPEPIVLSEKGAPLNVVTISATRDSEPSIRLKVEAL